MAKTPAWQRAEGKSESGGLNEKGRASLRAAGHDIKRPQPEGGSRKDSFCRRMKGMREKLTSSETANDPDSRINKSLRKWKCRADGGAVDDCAHEFVQEQLKSGEPQVPQYVAEADFPARAARGVEAVDTTASRVNNLLAGVAGQPAMRSPEGRSASEIVQSAMPVDPYQAVQQASRQWHEGDRLGAAETMATGMPMQGAIRKGAPGWYEILKDDKPVGTISLAGRNPDIKPFVSVSNIDPAYQRMGLGNEAYTDIEKDIGRKLVPSPLGLSEKAYGLWEKRLSGLPSDEVKSLLNEAKQLGLGYGISLKDIEERLSPFNKFIKKADGGSVDPYDSVQQAAKGGPIWDKPRPKKLGKPEPLSSKEKASAKAAAKAAGRPYPNLIDNMRAARADGGEVEGDVQFAPDDPYAKVQEASRLPMMAQNDFAMRMPEPEVRYDTGPQPGEATLKGYDPTIRERIYQGIAGTEERPSPERAQFARGMSQMAEFAPVLGNVMAGQEAQRRGDTKGMLMAALPVPGMATEARMAEAAMSPAQQAAQEAYQRVLNAQGLYSHAAEAAANLPQAKGSYEQMMAMLQKAGVKPEEMRWSGIEQFAGQPITREQLVQHFEQNVPKIEETVLGTGPIHQFGTPEEQEAALNRFNDARNAFWRAEYGSRDYHRIEQEFKDAEAALKDIVPGWGRAEGRQVNPSKFEQYTIPGGENYREVLMHMPPKSQMSNEDILNYMKANFPNTRSSDEELINRFNSLDKYQDKRGTYKSSHWDQPNVLGHLRLSDRTGPQGEKILHMEELQSDWGQAGRKKGFAQKITPEMQEKVNSIASKLDPKFVPPHARTSNGTGIDTENFLIRDINHWRDTGAITPDDANVLTQYANAKSGTGIPSAPYVENTQNWVDLGLKRALREAAEKGYDKLVWTPGAEQAARYDLSKHVDSLAWSPDTNELMGFKNDHVQFVETVPKDKLDEFIGKDAASKLVETDQYMVNNTGWHRLEGQDLKVGGKGMEGFYDKILPAQLQKIVKKLDPEAKIELGGHEIDMPDRGVTGYSIMSELPETRNMTEEEQNIWWRNLDPERRQNLYQEFMKVEPVKAHSITITPKMREAILKGLPAYAHGGEVVNKSDPYDNVRKAAKISPRARRAFH